MVGVVWLICGIVMIISGISSKKNPEKTLASKARQRKKNLSDEQYIATVYKTSIIFGILLIILGIIWFLVMWK